MGIPISHKRKTQIHPPRLVTCALGPLHTGRTPHVHVELSLTSGGHLSSTFILLTHVSIHVHATPLFPRVHVASSCLPHALTCCTHSRLLSIRWITHSHTHSPSLHQALPSFPLFGHYHR
jgi:hypothetical protein